MPYLISWPHAQIDPWYIHYSEVIMGMMASRITNLTIVYSTVYSGADQTKHRSPASLAFVRGVHRWPVNSPHKGPVTRNAYCFHLMTSFWCVDSIVMAGKCETNDSFNLFCRLVVYRCPHDRPQFTEMMNSRLKASLWIFIGYRWFFFSLRRRCLFIEHIRRWHSIYFNVHRKQSHSTACSEHQHRKHQTLHDLPFVKGIHCRTMDSLRIGSVIIKMFSCHVIISMCSCYLTTISKPNAHKLYIIFRLRVRCRISL